MVHEAVATMAAASGFEFIFVGDTDARHPQGMRGDPPTADIHVTGFESSATSRIASDTMKYRDLSAAVGIGEGPLMSRPEFALSRRVRRRVQARRVDGAIGK